MTLDYEQLMDLESRILEQLPDTLMSALSLLNRNGKLYTLLELLNLKELLEPQETLLTYPEGKIVVIGQTKVKEKELIAIAKQLGISEERLEFHLDYNVKKYNFDKFKYGSKYRVILFGPIPHSAKEKGDSSSILAEIENHPDIYPRVVRLTNDHSLKITKTNFREALNELIEESYI